MTRQRIPPVLPLGTVESWVQNPPPVGSNFNLPRSVREVDPSGSRSNGVGDFGGRITDLYRLFGWV